MVLPFEKPELLWKFLNPPTNKDEASQVVVVVNEPACNAEDPKDEGSIPGSGRAPGVGKGIPLHILAWKIP